MRTLDAIVLRLQTMGLGTPGVSIFAGTDVNLPDGAGPFLSILDTGGAEPDRTHNAGALRRPTVQVTSRGDLYPATAALAEQAWDALGGNPPIVNLDIGGAFFLWMHPAQELQPLPIDARGRVRLSFNVSALRR